MQKEIAREKRGIVIWGNEGNPNSLGQTEMKERGKWSEKKRKKKGNGLMKKERSFW